MSPEQLIDILRQTLWTTLEIAAPFLIIALIVGILISLFQTFTHIQEMTLSFVPKMIIVAAALAVFFPWMLKLLTRFTHQILIHKWDLVTSCY